MRGIDGLWPRSLTQTIIAEVAYEKTNPSTILPVVN